MIAHYSCNVKPDGESNRLDQCPEDVMHDQTESRTRTRFGRPPKPRDEVRSERVVSFVTRHEFESLLEMANDSGESVSAVVHRILRMELLKENRDLPG
jgi:hypothetical protein